MRVVMGITLAFLFLVAASLVVISVIASAVAAGEYDEASERYWNERKRGDRNVQDNKRDRDA